MIKRILCRALSLMLCALVLALGLSGVLFCCHCCERANCAICLAIGEALSMNRLMAVDLLVCVLALTAALTCEGMSHSRVVKAAQTLVSMRTMLLS